MFDFIERTLVFEQAYPESEHGVLVDTDLVGQLIEIENGLNPSFTFGIVNDDKLVTLEFQIKKFPSG